MKSFNDLVSKLGNRSIPIHSIVRKKLLAESHQFICEATERQTMKWKRHKGTAFDNFLWALRECHNEDEMTKLDPYISQNYKLQVAYSFSSFLLDELVAIDAARVIARHTYDEAIENGVSSEEGPNLEYLELLRSLIVRMNQIKPQDNESVEKFDINIIRSAMGLELTEQPNRGDMSGRSIGSDFLVAQDMLSPANSSLSATPGVEFAAGKFKASINKKKKPNGVVNSLRMHQLQEIWTTLAQSELDLPIRTNEVPESPIYLGPLHRIFSHYVSSSRNIRFGKLRKKGMVKSGGQNQLVDIVSLTTESKMLLSEDEFTKLSQDFKIISSEQLSLEECHILFGLVSKEIEPTVIKRTGGLGSARLSFPDPRGLSFGRFLDAMGWIALRVSTQPSVRTMLTDTKSKILHFFRTSLRLHDSSYWEHIIDFSSPTNRKANNKRKNGKGRLSLAKISMLKSKGKAAANRLRKRRRSLTVSSAAMPGFISCNEALTLFNPPQILKPITSIFNFYSKSHLDPSLPTFDQIAAQNQTLSVTEWCYFLTDFEVLPDQLSKDASVALFNAVHRAIYFPSRVASSTTDLSHSVANNAVNNISKPFPSSPSSIGSISDGIDLNGFIMLLLRCAVCMLSPEHPDSVIGQCDAVKAFLEMMCVGSGHKWRQKMRLHNSTTTERPAEPSLEW